MCKVCGYSGFVTAWNRRDGRQVAFRSNCIVASDRRISESIPEWSDARLGEWSLELIVVAPQKKERPEEMEKPDDLPNHAEKIDFKVRASDPRAYDEEE